MNKTSNHQTFWVIAAILIIAALSTSNCKLSDPDSLTLDQIMVFSDDLKDASLYANGVNRLKISIILVGDTPDQQVVTFKTDAGNFSSNPANITPDKKVQEISIKAAGRIAEVFLISSIKVENATVSASINNFTIFTIIPFLRYYPARIILSSNSTRLKPDGNDTAQLTVELIPPNDVGKVSEGTRIIFTAEDVESGKTLPELYRESLSEGGFARTAITGRVKGLVRITAVVADLRNISASILLEFAE